MGVGAPGGLKGDIPLPPSWLSHLIVLDGELELPNRVDKTREGSDVHFVTKF